MNKKKSLVKDLLRVLHIIYLYGISFIAIIYADVFNNENSQFLVLYFVIISLVVLFKALEKDGFLKKEND